MLYIFMFIFDASLGSCLAVDKGETGNLHPVGRTPWEARDKSRGGELNVYGKAQLKGAPEHRFQRPFCHSRWFIVRPL